MPAQPWVNDTIHRDVIRAALSTHGQYCRSHEVADVIIEGITEYPSLAGCDRRTIRQWVTRTLNKEGWFLWSHTCAGGSTFKKPEMR